MRPAGSADDAWEILHTPAPPTATVRGVEVKVGQRVRLAPRPGADAMDAAFAGRTAVIQSIDVTTDGEPQFAVTIDDDPGRDLGDRGYPGHRFFFRGDEIDVIGDAAAAPGSPRVLVAGIGNIFFGDDGFGVAVAGTLRGGEQPSGVVVRDFGIRGLDLAYALQDDYDAAILVDAMPKGGEPGALYVIEPDLADDVPLAAFDAHAMDPVRVLRLARSLGRIPRRVIIVGCEPASAEFSGVVGDDFTSLSDPVGRAVPDAVRVIETLIRDLINSRPSPRGVPCRQEP